MDAKGNSGDESAKTDLQLEQDQDTLKDEDYQEQPKQIEQTELNANQTTKSNVNLVDSKGVLYTMQDSQAALSQTKGKKSRQGFQNSKGSLTIQPPINKTPSKKSKTPLGHGGSSSAHMIPKMDNQDLKELDTLDEVNSQEKIKIQQIKGGLEKIDTDSQKEMLAEHLSSTLTPRAMNSSIENSTAQNVNRGTNIVNQQISIFDGSYNKQPKDHRNILIEQSPVSPTTEDKVNSQMIEDYEIQGGDSPIRIRKQPMGDQESASISNPQGSAINFNQSVSDIGASTQPHHVHESGRDSSQLQNYTPFANQEMLGNEFRTPHENARQLNDFDSNIQTDIKPMQSNVNQQDSSHNNIYSVNSPMSLQPHGIQRMEVNITKKDSLDHHGLQNITDRTNLFSSVDSQGNTGPENIEITNEGLSRWQQQKGPNIRQQHFKGKFFKRKSKEKKDEKIQKDLAIQEAKYSINGVQGNIMKLHALPSLSHAIAQQKYMHKQSKSNKHGRKHSMAETQRISDDGSIQTRRNTAQMKNQDINMMTATFQGTMDLEKTLYFNNRDQRSNDHNSFDGHDTRTTETKLLSADMKVSSLLQNKKLEDLIIDENQFNSPTHITPNMGVSQTPIEFSKAIGDSPMPPQSPTVIKINQIPSEGSDVINTIQLQNSQLQMSSGHDLGQVNQPQNILYARNTETIDRDRAANNETPNISNPNLNIGPRYSIDPSQRELVQGSEGTLKPGTIYQYDGFDSQSLEQMDPIAQLNQLNQMYSQQPQLSEYFNQTGVNVLPDHQYPHQVHSQMRAKNLNLKKKKISVPKPFGANVDPQTSRAQLQLMEQLWRQETQQAAEQPSSVGKQNQEFSQSMIRFKQSILNSQIKMNADPTRWMPTGSLVHDSQKQSDTKHFAPPSFRIEKVNNNVKSRNNSLEKAKKNGKGKQKDSQNILMPTCQTAQITHLGNIKKHPTSFIGSFVEGGVTTNSNHITNITNSPHIISQVGAHNMISVFSSIHEISGMKDTKAHLKKGKKESIRPQGIESIQSNNQYQLQDQSGPGSQLREGESDASKARALALQGGNPQNTQTDTTINFGNDHVFQSKSSADEGAFRVETNFPTNGAATKTELHDGLKGAGTHANSSSGVGTTDSPEVFNRQLNNASWAGNKNNLCPSTMRNHLEDKPISEAPGEETYSKPQSAMGKEPIIIRAKNTKEIATKEQGSPTTKGSKGQVLQPILQPIMGGRGSDYEGQLLQETRSSKKRQKRTTNQVSLIEKLELQSKLNLASSNHSGELFAQDSLPGMLLAPKGFQNQDYDTQKSPPSKRHNIRKAVQIGKHIQFGKGDKNMQKKFSTVYSSREGASQRRDTGSSKLTYRGSLGKSKGSKGNEDISHFLRNSAQKRSKSKFIIDQDSVQKIKEAKDQKVAYYSAIRQNLKSQTASEDNTSQATDPKYRLDPANNCQVDQENSLEDHLNAYDDHTPQSHHKSNVNYSFINYQEQRDDESKRNSNKKTQGRQQPYVMEKNSPYQTVYPSPQGLTTVSQNHKHHFATAQRADKIYLQQASSLDQKRKYEDFYNKRFSNIDQMVALMTKGLQKRISPKGEDRSLTPEGEANTKSTVKKHTQGSPRTKTKQNFKERSSSGSAQQSGSIERVSYQDKSFYFQQSTRHQGSIAQAQKTTVAFGSKDSSYFGQKPLQLQTQRGGRPEHLKMNATQKFGDKKNTQIFSSTIQIEAKNRRDQKTQDAHTPFNQHPFTPPYPNGFRQQVDSGEDVSMSAIQTPFNLTNNQNAGMNLTTNNFNPMLLEEDKNGMSSTLNGGFQVRHSPLQLQLNNQAAIEDSMVSASQSQGSNQDSYLHNAMKRMNKLEDRINENDSINIDTLNAKRTILPKLTVKGSKRNKIDQKMIESNDKDTRQLLRTLNMQEKLLQNLQLKEQLQYQRLITQNTQHKNFNFTQNSFGQSKKTAQQLSPNVDFSEIRQELKASLKSKDRVIIPQQSPKKQRRKFGSIQSSAVRLAEGIDGKQSVAMKDLFRKKGDTKYSRSVKANPKLEQNFAEKTQNSGQFANQKLSLMTDRVRDQRNLEKIDTLKIPTADLMKRESQEFELNQAHSISATTEHVNMATKQDFNLMMQQMNTSTYRAKFNPNHTQDSFGMNTNAQAHIRSKKAQSSKLKAPKGVLRQLSNQRGDNVGFATAYNFKDHLAQDSNISTHSGKTGQGPHSLDQHLTMKKTMNMIGDYFSDNSKYYQKYPNLIHQ